jgi:hypothetical protein
MRTRILAATAQSCDRFPGAVTFPGCDSPGARRENGAGSTLIDPLQSARMGQPGSFTEWTPLCHKRATVVSYSC